MNFEPPRDTVQNLRPIPNIRPPRRSILLRGGPISRHYGQTDRNDKPRPAAQRHSRLSPPLGVKQPSKGRYRNFAKSMSDFWAKADAPGLGSRRLLIAKLGHAGVRRAPQGPRSTQHGLREGCPMARPISTATPPVSPRRSSWCWDSRPGLLSNRLPDRTVPAGFLGRIGRRWFLAFWLSAPLSPLPVGGP